jgi:DNA integrity scanning protein DisA with diadenylate cyclase activity
MIEFLWGVLLEFWEFVSTNFDPWRDTIDLLLVTLGIYWLLILIRGTRAVQILVGLIVLIALSVASELFQLLTLGLILQNFLGSAVLIIIILFQNDIRRALPWHGWAAASSHRSLRKRNHRSSKRWCGPPRPWPSGASAR